MPSVFCNMVVMNLDDTLNSTLTLWGVDLYLYLLYFSVLLLDLADILLLAKYVPHTYILFIDRMDLILYEEGELQRANELTNEHK